LQLHLPEFLHLPAELGFQLLPFIDPLLDQFLLPVEFLQFPLQEGLPIYLG
jgi:hypothetical protein